MRSWRTFVAALAAAGVLAGCGLVPNEAPSDAAKADFCGAYAASKGLVDRAPGAAISRWDAVRTAMATIHTIGTPAGSDGPARKVVLRLSDIVTNAEDPTHAQQQVDAYFDQNASAKATMTDFYGGFCA